MSVTPTLRHFVFAAATFVAFSFTAQHAYAAVVTLKSLFDGGELSIGDKRFFDWTLVSDDSIDGLTGTPETRDFNKINVATFSNGPLELGVEYTDSSDADAQMFSEGGTYDLVSFTWTYRVETISGDPMIIGSELDMTGTYDVGTSGDFAFVDINEDVFQLDATTLIADMEVFAFGDFPPDQPFDSGAFAEQQEVFVETTIELSSGDVDDASLFEFVQTYEQVVPEPSTITLWSFICVAGIGYGWWRKRKV